MTLNDYLTAVAKATDLRTQVNPNIPEIQAFRKAMEDDFDLKQHARAMLLEIDPKVVMRDHISRWRKAALEAALGETL